jgi:hypothetical protein
VIVDDPGGASIHVLLRNPMFPDLILSVPRHGLRNSRDTGRLAVLGRKMRVSAIEGGQRETRKERFMYEINNMEWSGQSKGKKAEW